MNENFDFQIDPQNEINMSDSDKRSHKKIFSKICLAFLAYMAISQVLSVVAGLVIGLFAPQLFYSQDFLMLITSVIQYVIAFPILYKLLKSIPKQAPVRTRVGAKRFLKYAAVAMLFMYIGNYISNFLLTWIESLLGRVPENAVNAMLDNTNIFVSLLIVGIVGPIFEELIFRKLFIDRLMPYGDKVAIFLPALIFGLFHGNLYQFFYAFFIGAVFSYIYIKTGEIMYSTLLHIFINIFCGVFPTAIFSMLDYNELIEIISAGALTEEYLNANILPLSLFLIYSYGMLAMVGIGLIVFWRNARKIQFNKGEIRFPKGSGGDIMFFNVGSIALIMSCILLIAYNTFAL